MKKTGVLPGAPLLYVLASVRFSALLKLPDAIPAIQDALREQLPLVYEMTFENINVSTLGIPGGQPSIEKTIGQAWAFMAADRSSGCQISLDQIIVHTRSYKTFSKFAELVSIVVSEVEKHARSFDVNAMGIRYLDRISPSNGDELKAYLKPGFLAEPLQWADFELLGGMSHRLYKTKTGVLQARFWSGNGYSEVPDDLVPLYLLTEDSSVQAMAPKFLEPGHGTLDTDSIWSSPTLQRMDTARIVGELDALHAHANAFFREACSDHAFQVWNEGAV